MEETRTRHKTPAYKLKSHRCLNFTTISSQRTVQSLGICLFWRNFSEMSQSTHGIAVIRQSENWLFNEDFFLCFRMDLVSYLYIVVEHHLLVKNLFIFNRLSTNLVPIWPFAINRSSTEVLFGINSHSIFDENFPSNLQQDLNIVEKEAKKVLMAFFPQLIFNANVATDTHKNKLNLFQIIRFDFYMIYISQAKKMRSECEALVSLTAKISI